MGWNNNNYDNESKAGGGGIKGLVNRMIEFIGVSGATSFSQEVPEFWEKQEYLIGYLAAITKPYYETNAAVVAALEDAWQEVSSAGADKHKLRIALNKVMTELSRHYRRLNWLGDLDKYDYPIYGEETEREMTFKELLIDFLKKNDNDLDKLGKFINDAINEENELEKRYQAVLKNPNHTTLEKIIHPALAKKMLDAIAKKEEIMRGYNDSKHEERPSVSG